MTESMLLALSGGVAGLLLATRLVRRILAARAVSHQRFYALPQMLTNFFRKVVIDAAA